MDEKHSFRIRLKQICDTLQKTICQLESDLCDIDALQHEDELKDFKKVVCENVVEDFKLVAQFLGIQNCTKLLNDFLHLLLTQNGLIELLETDGVELKSESVNERLEHTASSASYGPTTRDEDFRVKNEELCELFIKEEERDDEGIIREIENDLLQEPIDQEFDNVCEIKKETSSTETNDEKCDVLHHPIDKQFENVNETDVRQHTDNNQSKNGLEKIVVKVEDQDIAALNEMERISSNATSIERNGNDLVQVDGNTVSINQIKTTNNDNRSKTSQLLEDEETNRNDLLVNLRVDNKDDKVCSVDMLKKTDDSENIVVIEPSTDECRRDEHVTIEDASSSHVVVEGERQEHEPNTDLCSSVHDNVPTMNIFGENEFNIEQDIENTNDEIGTDVSFRINEFKSNTKSTQIEKRRPTHPKPISNQVEYNSSVDLENKSNNKSVEIMNHIRIDSKKPNAAFESKSNKRKLKNKSIPDQKTKESNSKLEEMMSIHKEAKNLKESDLIDKNNGNDALQNSHNSSTVISDISVVDTATSVSDFQHYNLNRRTLHSMNHCKLQTKEKVDYYLNNQMTENFENVYSPFTTNSSEWSSVNSLDGKRRKVRSASEDICEPSKMDGISDGEDNGRTDQQCSEEDKENSNPMNVNSEEMDNGYNVASNEISIGELVTRKDDGRERTVDVTCPIEKSTIFYQKEGEGCIELTHKDASPSGLSENVLNANVNADGQNSETLSEVCAENGEDDGLEIVYENIRDKLLEKQLNHVEIINVAANMNSNNGDQIDATKTLCTRNEIAENSRTNQANIVSDSVEILERVLEGETNKKSSKASVNNKSNDESGYVDIIDLTQDDAASFNKGSVRDNLNATESEKLVKAEDNEPLVKNVSDNTGNSQVKNIDLIQDDVAPFNERSVRDKNEIKTEKLVKVEDNEPLVRNVSDNIGNYQVQNSDETQDHAAILNERSVRGKNLNETEPEKLIKAENNEPLLKNVSVNVGNNQVESIDLTQDDVAPLSGRSVRDNNLSGTESEQFVKAEGNKPLVKYVSDHTGKYQIENIDLTQDNDGDEVFNAEFTHVNNSHKTVEHRKMKQLVDGEIDRTCVNNVGQNIVITSVDRNNSTDSIWDENTIPNSERYVNEIGNNSFISNKITNQKSTRIKNTGTDRNQQIKNIDLTDEEDSLFNSGFQDGSNSVLTSGSSLMVNNKNKESSDIYKETSENETVKNRGNGVSISQQDPIFNERINRDSNSFIPQEESISIHDDYESINSIGVDDDNVGPSSSFAVSEETSVVVIEAAVAQNENFIDDIKKENDIINPILKVEVEMSDENETSTNDEHVNLIIDSINSNSEGNERESFQSPRNKIDKIGNTSDPSPSGCKKRKSNDQNQKGEMKRKRAVDDTEVQDKFIDENVSFLKKKSNVRNRKKRKSKKKKPSLLDYVDLNELKSSPDGRKSNVTTVLPRSGCTDVEMDETLNQLKTTNRIRVDELARKRILESSDDEETVGSMSTLEQRQHRTNVHLTNENVDKTAKVSTVVTKTPVKESERWKKDPLLNFTLNSSSSDSMKKPNLNSCPKRVRKENLKEVDEEEENDVISVCSMYQEQVKDPQLKRHLQNLLHNRHRIVLVSPPKRDFEDEEVINLSSDEEDDEDVLCLDPPELDEQNSQNLDEEFKRIAKKRTKGAITLQKKAAEMVSCSNDKSNQDSIFMEDRLKDVIPLVLCIDEDENDAITVCPFYSKILKEHQKRGVKFMWDKCFGSRKQIRNEEGSGCILAHDMGLGKSLQVIALLHSLKRLNDPTVSRILLLTPKSLVSNWEDEVQKWTKGLAVKLDVYIWTNDKDETVKDLHEWSAHGGIYILSYQMFVSLCKKRDSAYTADEQDRTGDVDLTRPLFLNPGPDLVVCDEAHLLKNSRTETYKAVFGIRTKRRIALTGTPIQNNLDELFNLVQLVQPMFMRKDKFRDQFVRPISLGQNVRATREEKQKATERISVLHKELEKVMDREQGSTQEIGLPPKINYDIFLNLSDVQQKLYKHFCDQMKTSFKASMIFSAVRIAEIIGIHPKSLENVRKSYDKKTDGANGPVHDWPEDLKGNWWTKVLSGERDLQEFARLESGFKIKMAFDILQHAVARNDKVLVFCGSLEVLSLMESYLKERKFVKNVNYFRLDGNVPHALRKKYMNHFNDERNKDANVFLLTHLVGGVGLNFTSANRTIILDMPWNPSHHEQSSNRTYRIGQKKTSFVYRLITKGTLEEKIYKTTVSKQSLSKRVVDKIRIKSFFRQNDLFDFTFETDSTTRRDLPLAKDDLLNMLMQNKETDMIHSYFEQGEMFEMSEEQLNEAQAYENYLAESTVSQTLKKKGGRKRKSAVDAKDAMVDTMMTQEHIENYDHASLLHRMQRKEPSDVETVRAPNSSAQVEAELFDAHHFLSGFESSVVHPTSSFNEHEMSSESRFGHRSRIGSENRKLNNKHREGHGLNWCVSPPQTVSHNNMNSSAQELFNEERNDEISSDFGSSHQSRTKSSNGKNNRHQEGINGLNRCVSPFQTVSHNNMNSSAQELFIMERNDSVPSQNAIYDGKSCDQERFNDNRTEFALSQNTSHKSHIRAQQQSSQNEKYGSNVDGYAPSGELSSKRYKSLQEFLNSVTLLSTGNERHKQNAQKTQQEYNGKDSNSKASRNSERRQQFGETQKNAPQLQSFLEKGQKFAHQQNATESQRYSERGQRFANLQNSPESLRNFERGQHFEENQQNVSESQRFFEKSQRFANQQIAPESQRNFEIRQGFEMENQQNHSELREKFANDEDESPPRFLENNAQSKLFTSSLETSGLMGELNTAPFEQNNRRHFMSMVTGNTLQEHEDVEGIRNGLSNTRTYSLSLLNNRRQHSNNGLESSLIFSQSSTKVCEQQNTFASNKNNAQRTSKDTNMSYPSSSSSVVQQQNRVFFATNNNGVRQPLVQTMPSHHLLSMDHADTNLNEIFMNQNQTFQREGSSNNFSSSIFLRPEMDPFPINSGTIDFLLDNVHQNESLNDFLRQMIRSMR